MSTINFHKNHLYYIIMTTRDDTLETLKSLYSLYYKV